MKKLILLSIITICTFLQTQAQVLNVTNNEQLYDQWCWAGCSKTILDYYGFSAIQQCDIAEYVRNTATFNNFGTTNCCTNATQGCNYWNYNWGYAGSIQDILIHFGGIQNTGVGALSQAEIISELQNNRLFVIRWGWSSGGGHFIVGHGISGNNVYFMNPWFGEGLHIGTYNFINSGIDNTSSATHTWTHTNIITNDVSSAEEINDQENSLAYPNPFIVETTLKSKNVLNNASLTLYNHHGQAVKQMKNINGQNVIFQRDNLPAGLYFYRLSEGNIIYPAEKLVISDY